jgi:hypothetical protein
MLKGRNRETTKYAGLVFGVALIIYLAYDF